MESLSKLVEDVETGTIETLELSKDEAAAHLAEVEEFKAEELAKVEQAKKDKADKEALLSKLGITDEEAKLLIG